MRATIHGMPTKAQHSWGYQRLPPFLRNLRVEAGLTQRDLGERLSRPQSWVHNCETGNRRVDVMEFIGWCEACDLKPENGFGQVLKMRR